MGSYFQAGGLQYFEFVRKGLLQKQELSAYHLLQEIVEPLSLQSQTFCHNYLNAMELQIAPQ